jgi:hypothetical protein
MNIRQKINFKSSCLITKKLFVLAALLCFLIYTCRDTQAASMCSGMPNIRPNIERSDGTVISFAGQEWWVIGYNGTGVFTKAGDVDNVTLLLKSAGNPYGNSTFRAKNATGGSGWVEYPVGSGAYFEGSFSMPSDYNDSTLHRNTSALAGDVSYFPAKELALINPRTLFASTPGEDNDEIGGAAVINQKLWALSQEEWTEIGDDTARSFGTFFWMRSPYVDVNATFGFPTGGQMFFNLVANDLAIRPALNLNLSSVLFTSAASAESGKTIAPPGRLSSVGALGGAIKFTVEVADASFLSIACTDTAERIVEAGSTIRIAYSGAQTAANKFVSCVIENKDGMLLYGRITNVASGTVSFVVPADLPDGVYSIKLFNEECNLDSETDYACRPVSIPLAVYNPAPPQY